MHESYFSQFGYSERPVPPSRLTTADRLFVTASLVGVILWSFAPTAAAAQMAVHQPFIFAINNFDRFKDWPLPMFAQEYFADALVGNRSAAPAPDPRVEILQQYLESKKSPLSEHAETLLKHNNYRLIIGISFAESNFCKKNIRPHNCWGIGGTRPESYADYDEALTRANSLIQKYHNSGLTSPKLMRNRWVGWENHNWILAVEQATSALEARGL